MNEKPPKPANTPPLEYDEKEVLGRMAKTPTGEWPVPPPIAHAIKQLAAVTDDAQKKLKKRNSTRNAAIVSGLLGIGGGGYGTWNAHDKADDLGRRVHQLERANEKLQEQVTEARVELARCCK